MSRQLPAEESRKKTGAGNCPEAVPRGNPYLLTSKSGLVKRHTVMQRAHLLRLKHFQ
jgi:hypothetical protein